MSNRWLIVSIFFAIATSTTFGNSRSISKAQARELVLKFMQEDGYNTSASNFYLEEINDPSFPDFYLFGASVDNPERLDSAGEYVVDPTTADVQEMSICVPPKSAAVRKFQAQLRKSIGLSASEYRKLKKRHPLPCYK